MKILCLECSAVPCSVAVIEDGNIISNAFVNVKCTHSQTLMPLVESVLASSMLTLNDIDGFAISKGPGSFTGIRIGISAVKGLAASESKPCVGVSTLSAIAENYRDTDCIVCAVMDARCNQVYNALFSIENGVISRMCEDRAILCDELAEELKQISQTDKSIIIVGDGTDVFLSFTEGISNIKKSDIKRRFQNAVGVGMAASKNFENGDTVESSALLPLYLRLPQAERELNLKRGKEK